MKIAVLISIAKHSQSARLIPSPLDLKACALALDLKQQSGAELDFIHFGKPSSVLDDYLAYGLGKISCYPVADGFQVASICATLKNFDLDHQRSGGDEWFCQRFVCLLLSRCAPIFLVTATSLKQPLATSDCF